MTDQNDPDKLKGPGGLTLRQLHQQIMSATQSARVKNSADPIDYCFVAGTLVHTKEGLKPIEEICVGDWILSYPDDQVPPPHMREEYEYTYRRVTHTFIHEDKLVCEVTTINFASNAKETLKATLEHPFFVDGVGWIPASELGFGHALLSENFGNLAIAECTINGERARVYNFEVDEFHSYYVGRLGAWVHNKCGDSHPFPALRDIKTEAPI